MNHEELLSLQDSALKQYRRAMNELGMAMAAILRSLSPNQDTHTQYTEEGLILWGFVGEAHKQIESCEIWLAAPIKEEMGVEVLRNTFTNALDGVKEAIMRLRVVNRRLRLRDGFYCPGSSQRNLVAAKDFLEKSKDLLNELLALLPPRQS